MRLVTEHGPQLGVAPSCVALGVARASYYRSRQPRPESRPRPTPVRALAPAEREQVLAVLHEPRFVDLAPAEVYATLLDEGRYLCSERTFYRLLAAAAEVRERRDQLRHPRYAAPELLASRPNELWSWDITKLLGPTKWTYYLYVLLDVFSRYVVGWMLAEGESARLAEKLIAESCERQRIAPGHLTVHADRGPAMTSKPVALLLADLGVTKSHSRPHVSNDNPYSESQFKTLKYRPDFPDRFGSLEHGRSFCGDFFPWYNTEHHHVGLGLFTPHDVHFGLAEAKRQKRALVLAEAFAKNPERFPNGRPSPRPLPTAAWINPPKVPAVAGEVANPMTLESDAAAIGAVRASCDVDLEHERSEIFSMSFSRFGCEGSAGRAAGWRAARAHATLPPARSASTYRARAVGAKGLGEGAELQVLVSHMEEDADGVASGVVAATVEEELPGALGSVNPVASDCGPRLRGGTRRGSAGEHLQ